MNNRVIHELKIDSQFRDLIPPLTIDERKQLEDNLIAEGCRDPICIWHGYIVDGHNRYEICKRRNIPFEVKAIKLPNRAAVISWICSNQLGRRNISEETRRYLIGKRYDTEKIKGAKNKSGTNSKKKTKELSELEREHTHRTAESLGKEYHLSHQTIQKYGAYSRALDYITKLHPEFGRRVLNGDIRISQNNLIDAAQLSLPELRKFVESCEANGEYVPYSNSRKILNDRSPVMRPKPQKAQIKNMPKYDPDAEISSLAFTVPTWINSMERVKTKADLSCCTEEGKNRLINTLQTLQIAVDKMIVCIKEAN